jgi:hypothetical protein
MSVVAVAPIVNGEIAAYTHPTVAHACVNTDIGEQCAALEAVHLARCEYPYILFLEDGTGSQGYPWSN